MKVSHWLLEEGRKVRQNEVAKLLGVTPRTLRNWNAHAKMERPPKIGRPVYTQTIQNDALWRVGRELRRQGYPGWRPIVKALGGSVPTRLVQNYVGLLKRRRKLRLKRRYEQLRVRTEVLAKNVLWTQDATQLGRVQGKAILAEVVKDRATLKNLEVRVVKNTNGESVIEIFEALKSTRGLPLVWMTDNGSNYCSQTVEDYLQKERVIHLKSLPRTPQHNAAAERAVCELKQVSDLTSAGTISDPWTVEQQLKKANLILNHHRLRASKSFKSAAEIDDIMRERTDINRAVFYDRCCRRIKQETERAKTRREERKLAREAIYATLQEYGLVKRTRGGMAIGEKEEVFL